MMDTMYEIPSDSSITKCIITKDTADGKCGPVIERREENGKSKKSGAKSIRIKDDNEIA